MPEPHAVGASRAGRAWPPPEPRDAAWRRALAPPDLTLAEAMVLVDLTGGAVIVDPEDRLIGTLTDTDIRRALLRGAGRHDAARPFLNMPTLRAGATCARTVPVPIVDDRGRVIGVEPAAAPALADRLVVLMAGGRGTRLRPVTAQCPKPLLPIAGRPLLEITIEGLRARGFRRFVLCVGYRANMIEQHFGDGGRFGVQIDYVRDGGRLGTAAPIALIEDRPARAFVVINGDIVTSAPVDRLLAFHEESRVDATVAVCDVEVQVPFGVVQLTDGRVGAIREKPTERCFVNAGMYVLEPSVIDLIPRGRPGDMPAVLEAAVARGDRVGAFPLHEPWSDIGTPRDLEDVAARLKRDEPASRS